MDKKECFINIFPIFTLVLIILKMFKIINLTWFQCFLPFIIMISFSLIYTIILLIFIIKK